MSKSYNKKILVTGGAGFIGSGGERKRVCVPFILVH